MCPPSAAPDGGHRAPAQLFQHLVVVVCIHKGLGGFLHHGAGYRPEDPWEFDEFAMKKVIFYSDLASLKL